MEKGREIWYVEC